MKTSLRPNTKNDECEHKDVNKVPFVEPIWLFNKNNDERCILKYNECEDLSDFFE